MSIEINYRKCAQKSVTSNIPQFDRTFARAPDQSCTLYSKWKFSFNISNTSRALGTFVKFHIIYFFNWEEALTSFTIVPTPLITSWLRSTRFQKHPNWLVCCSFQIFVRFRRMARHCNQKGYDRAYDRGNSFKSEVNIDFTQLIVPILCSSEFFYHFDAHVLPYQFADLSFHFRIVSGFHG